MQLNKDHNIQSKKQDRVHSSTNNSSVHTVEQAAIVCVIYGDEVMCDCSYNTVLIDVKWSVTSL